jgi:hypothetical protein
MLLVAWWLRCLRCLQCFARISGVGEKGSVGETEAAEPYVVVDWNAARRRGVFGQDQMMRGLGG